MGARLKRVVWINSVFRKVTSPPALLTLSGISADSPLPKALFSMDPPVIFPHSIFEGNDLSALPARRTGSPPGGQWCSIIEHPRQTAMGPFSRQHQFLLTLLYSIILCDLWLAPMTSAANSRYFWLQLMFHHKP